MKLIYVEKKLSVIQSNVYIYLLFGLNIQRKASCQNKFVKMICKSEFIKTWGCKHYNMPVEILS